MTISQLRSFLGLAGFYRRFVKDFSTLAAPLNDLTKKGVVFEWGVAQDIAFDELKRHLISAPLLILPDFNKQFEIECWGCWNRRTWRLPKIQESGFS